MSKKKKWYNNSTTYGLITSNTLWKISEDFPYSVQLYMYTKVYQLWENSRHFPDVYKNIMSK